MCKYYFSKTTCSFYPEELLEDYIKAGTLPDDAVPVLDGIYETYTGNPPEGKSRGADSKGQPQWIDTPEPSKEDAVLVATMRKQQLMADAEGDIALLSRAVKYAIATDEELTRLEALERYTVLLEKVNTNDAPDIDWPEFPVQNDN